jgi:hypothetical protein
MDEKEPHAEAVSFSNGRILDVGTEKAVLRRAGSNVRIFDAGGRAVLPGFIDCHTHFLSMGVWSGRLDLYGMRSRSEVLGAVKKAAAGKTRREWVLGRGWDETIWPGSACLTREELDAAAPRNPAMLIRVCGHLAVLNSKGMALLGGRMGAEGVDRSAGLITEGALEKARCHLRPAPEETAAGLEYSLSLAKKRGVTSVHDIIDIPKFRAYEAARCSGSLSVRACLHFEKSAYSELLRMGLHSGWGGPLVRIGGMKLYADGSLGARTAALREPYSDAPSERGVLLHSAAGLRSVVRHSEKSGVQLLVHAIGDRAVERVVSAFSSAIGGRSRVRHRIEHLELVDRPGLARMRRLGLWASMQPNFVGAWGLPGGMMESRLGKRRYRRADPFRTVLGAGVPLVFGSDCMPFSPLFGIHSAVNAPFPAQRLTVEQAVAAYTRDGAAASFEEGFKGTLVPGKAADMVILSEDPFRNPKAIRDIRVEATIFDGRVMAN